jgi:DNA-binding Xre family transcriptional regulator
MKMDVKDFDLEAIGKKIRHLLIDKDSTITLLAEDIGTSRQGLYNKINNNTWTVADIYKVAKALEVEPKDLIGG